MRGPKNSSVEGTARTTVPEDGRRSEAGDTLIEVLLALIVLGLASLAMLVAFTTTIKATAEHRNLATTNTALVTISQDMKSLVQVNAVAFFKTDNSASYQGDLSPLIPNGYTLMSLSVAYWNGTSFCSSTPTPACSFIINAPEMVTFTIKNNVTGLIYTNSVVVDDPLTQTLPTSSGTASQLIFMSQPSAATYNSVFVNQPVVEVEDSSNNVVTSDLSPITMTITSGTGTSGASLSGCVGIETSGVISWSGCSINMLGTSYRLTVSGPNGLTGQSAAFSVTPLQLGVPGITQVVPSATTAGAVTISYTGSSNAPTGQTYNAVACTDSQMSLNCVNQSNYTSGSQFTGLTPGTAYYVQVIANASTGYLAATSPPSRPALATVQLASPSGVILNYGTVAGSVGVAFTGSSNAPVGQVYAVEECADSGMTTNCNSVWPFTSGANFTGLSYTAGQAGSTYYYFAVTALASTGYLVSPATTPASSHYATSKVNVPTGFTAASSPTTSGVITFSFAASTGTPPTNYTVAVCTDILMSQNCVSLITPVTANGQLTGLTPGTTYYVQVTANTPSTAYASASTAVSAATVATAQLVAPTGVTLGYGTAAGSVSVNFTGSSNAPSGQTYTAEACTNVSNFTSGTGCVTQTGFTSGSNLTGLTYVAGVAGTTYYVQIAAIASAGYLAASSAQNGQSSGHDTSAETTPAVTVTAGSTSGQITVQVTTISAPAPSSYTCNFYSSSTLSAGSLISPPSPATCSTTTGTVNGLTAGSTVWVTVTANSASTAYASVTTLTGTSGTVHS